MNSHKNFFGRAVDALIAGREREAKRYVDRFEREHPNLKSAFTKR